MTPGALTRAAVTVIAAAAACFAAFEAGATVEIGGTVSYRVDGDTVTLEVDEIANRSESRTTGTLYLTLWMTADADPYTAGHRVARVSLAELDGEGFLPPGYYYSDIQLTTDYERPPAGTYYVHLFVSEYPDLETVLDLRTFTESVTIEEPVSNVAMEGTVAFRVDGDAVTLEVDRIVNHSDSRTTGTLHLTLWMTDGVDPYAAGHVAARVSLAELDGVGVLSPGYAYNDVRLTGDYEAPPPGTYYVHLYVSEYPDVHVVLDLLTFTDTVVIEDLRDDHGNERADATLVAAPSTTRGRIEQGGDIDVFRVDLAGDGVLQIGTVGATDTHGTLVGADGRTIAIDDDGGEGLNFLMSVNVQAGTWYIEVRGYDRTTTGAYSLSVGFGPAPGEQPDASTFAQRLLGDFNGDGRDDVLLRHADGRWYYYPMNGRRAIASGKGTANLTKNLDYRVAGIGDFNGDGRDDVLLRHLDGRWYYYPMNGRRFVADGRGTANLTRDLDYRVAGIGDFNGDGRDDVLLRHADGRWYYYPMNGRRFISGRGSANLTRNLDYAMAGVGDLSGDGRDDVLLRHADGRWYYYPMNGRRSVSGRGSANLTRNLDFRVAGVGDFNGDGRADVLLRRADGRWYYYPMNGRRFVSGRGSANLTRNLDYGVAGIGDLNGDGRDDVLLRHADGRWYYYPMNGRRHIDGRGSANLTRDLEWAVPGGSGRRTGLAVISGTLAVTPGQVLDGDTNDPRDPEQNNDGNTPQRVPLPVSVAGYAHETDDPEDVYRMHFPAPVRISLAIADPDNTDLDLYLLDANGTIVEQSLGVDNLEVIQTTRTGTHLVVVEAFSGAGNYSLVASIVETASGAVAASADSWSRDGEFVLDELIVKPSAPTTQGLLASLTETLTAAAALGLIDHARTPAGLVLLRAVPQARTMPVAPLGGSTERRYATDELRRRAATLLLRKRLQRSGAVEYAQPNYIYRSMAIPNDPYYDFQWHYPHINLPDAWDLTTGDDDIVTAVIDSGVVTDHPDIAPRLLRDSRNRVVGYDFISDPVIAGDGDGIDPDAYDVGDSAVFGQSSSFHGTHVAGTIGAATNNGDGVAGVTWRGRIMPIRVLGVGGGSSWDIAQGIRYAAGLRNDSGELPPKPADIANLSLGTPNERCMRLPSVDAVTRRALEGAIDAGVVVVVAAGNDDCHVPAPMSTVDGVISVGATDLYGRAPYSNFGSTVDVVAPGGNLRKDDNGDGYVDGVLSVVADDAESPLQHTYNFQEGTSMAAPHFAGVVGLMLAVNPRLTPHDINRLLAGTHADPAAAPITRDLGTPGRDDEFGHGLIDAAQAVRIAQAIRGGDGRQPDHPVLAVSPTRLHFGATADVLRVQLSNAGGGSLTVATVAPDVSWMTVSFEWPTLVVRVDRSGLGQRTHVGRIRITSDGGELTIPATMQVQRNVLAADVGTAYVLAVDPETYETQAMATTNVRDGYAFEMPDVPLGAYVIAAGTDRNNDGFICDAGEACGIWPLLDSPAVVELDGDQTLDFGVSIDLFARVTSQSVRSAKVGRRGFRIHPAAKAEAAAE